MLVFLKEYPLSVRIISYVWVIITLCCYGFFIATDIAILFFIPPFLSVVFSLINYLIYKRGKRNVHTKQM